MCICPLHRFTYPFLLSPSFFPLSCFEGLLRHPAPLKWPEYKPHPRPEPSSSACYCALPRVLSKILLTPEQDQKTVILDLLADTSHPQVKPPLRMRVVVLDAILSTVVDPWLAPAFLLHELA